MVELKYGKGYYHLQSVMYDWCEEKFGPGTWASPQNGEFPSWAKCDWTMDTIFGNTFVYFKNAQDATLFALRWSNES